MNKERGNIVTIEETMKFSTNLKTYLKKNNMSLKELSNLLGVPMSTAHGWINGVPPKNITTIKEISQILNLSIDELCFGDLEKNIDSNLTISIGDQSYRVVLKKVSKK